jgi:hypothetical protein
MHNMDPRQPCGESLVEILFDGGQRFINRRTEDIARGKLSTAAARRRYRAERPVDGGVLSPCSIARSSPAAATVMVFPHTSTCTFPLPATGVSKRPVTLRPAHAISPTAAVEAQPTFLWQRRRLSTVCTTRCQASCGKAITVRLEPVDACRKRRVQILPLSSQYLAFVIQRVADMLLLGCRLSQRLLRRGVQAVHLRPFGLRCWRWLSRSAAPLKSRQELLAT